MDIIAIDAHSHIHYAPLETAAPVRISDIMQEGPYYTAYWKQLSQINKKGLTDWSSLFDFFPIFRRGHVQNTFERANIGRHILKAGLITGLADGITLLNQTLGVCNASLFDIF